MKILFILGVFCAVSASAQSISVGVLGGAPFTDVVSNTMGFAPTSTNFTIGPTSRSTCR
jgi:hypothetical protein